MSLLFNTMLSVRCIYEDKIIRCIHEDKQVFTKYALGAHGDTTKLLSQTLSLEICIKLWDPFPMQNHMLMGKKPLWGYLPTWLAGLALPFEPDPVIVIHTASTQICRLPRCWLACLCLLAGLTFA